VPRRAASSLRLCCGSGAPASSSHGHPAEGSAQAFVSRARDGAVAWSSTRRLSPGSAASLPAVDATTHASLSGRTGCPVNWQHVEGSAAPASCAGRSRAADEPSRACDSPLADVADRPALGCDRSSSAFLRRRGVPELRRRPRSGRGSECRRLSSASPLRTHNPRSSPTRWQQPSPESRPRGQLREARAELG
jgi:hypothetical protein